jgi:large subunit ribosomal protein L25
MEVTLSARSRPLKGKGPARRVRSEGLVPGIIYGRELQPVPVAVDAKAMYQALHTESGANVLVNLELDGERFLVMPREIQRHPIRGTLMHVDFVNIARDVQITADVPIHLVGEAHGVKMGGLIEHHLWEVRVQALPSNVPNTVEVDVRTLDIGQQVRVSDIPIPPGVEVLTPAEEIVAAVVEARVELPPEPEVEEAEAAELAAEGEEGAEAAGGAEEKAAEPEE